MWHIEYIRRTHPQAADRTATLKRWCRDLAGTTGSLTQRVVSIDVGHARLEPWEEVDDPAGGDVELVSACARAILRLLTVLAEEVAAP
jgi:hypothetical protein